VIVRIATESQYRLPDDDAAQLNDLDNEAVSAVEAGDEDRFHEVFESMLDLVRSSGHVLDEDELREAEREGWVQAETATRAREEAAALLEAARRGAWPGPEVHAWTLERARETVSRRAAGND